MSIDSTSAPHIRLVSSSETSLGTFLKQSKRKVCEKSCGHHLIHKLVPLATNSTMKFRCIVVKKSLCQIIRHLTVLFALFFFFKNEERSKLYRSNKQSQSTLCVLVTCATLSLNRYRWVECDLLGMWSGAWSAYLTMFPRHILQTEELDF